MHRIAQTVHYIVRLHLCIIESGRRNCGFDYISVDWAALDWTSVATHTPLPLLVLTTQAQCISIHWASSFAPLSSSQFWFWLCIMHLASLHFVLHIAYVFHVNRTIQQQWASLSFGRTSVRPNNAVRTNWLPPPSFGFVLFFLIADYWKVNIIGYFMIQPDFVEWHKLGLSASVCVCLWAAQSTWELNEAGWGKVKFQIHV